MEISKIKQELLADAVVDESTGLDSDLRGKLNGLNSVGTEPDAPKVRLSLNDVKEYVETGPGQKSDRLATLNELLKVDEEIAGKNQYSLYSTKARAFIQSQSAIPALKTSDVETGESVAATSNSSVKAVALSDEAKRAGFVLSKNDSEMMLGKFKIPVGCQFIQLPATNTGVEQGRLLATYPPNLSADDTFTKLDFDPKNQTLSFETSRGEQGVIKIDWEKHKLTVTTFDPDGNLEPVIRGDYTPNGR